MLHSLFTQLHYNTIELGRSPTSSSHGVERVRSNQAYPLCLVVFVSIGFLIRVLGAYFFHGIIDTEGAEYARIAENLLSGAGYVGIATPGTQLFFPPLFPLLIAAGSLITGDIESGGLLVSVIAGTSLIWSTYLIGCHLYGRRTGNVAAALVALHPLLIGWSITLYCEATYLGLALPGLYFGLRAISDQRARLFAIAGCFFGTAYLVRPEAIFYPALLIGAALLHALLTNRSRTWVVLFRSFWTIAAFLPLVLPYIIWLSVNVGEVRIEGKSPLNIATGERTLSGMTGYEASFAVDDQMIERGIWLQPNLSVIQSRKLHATSFWPYLRAKLVPTILRIGYTICLALPLGAPVLSILALFGLVRSSWRRETISEQIVLLAVVAISLLALPLIYYASVRFFIVFLAVSLIWAAHGLCELSDWVRPAALSYISRLPILANFAQRSVVGAGVMVLVLISLLGSKSLGELRNFDYSSRPIKLAGKWLQQQSASRITIADTWTPLAFHAHAAFVWLPYASSETALQYLDQHHVDYIVVSDRDQNSTPYLKNWVQNGIPDRRAHLVYYFYIPPPFGGTAIYRWVSENGLRTP